MSLTELKEKAEAATPGEWHQKYNEKNMSDTFVVSSREISPSKSTYILAQTFGKTLLQSEKDAEFIAAANPQVVLALIACAEALKYYADDETRNENNYKMITPILLGIAPPKAHSPSSPLCWKRGGDEK